MKLTKKLAAMTMSLGLAVAGITSVSALSDTATPAAYGAGMVQRVSGQLNTGGYLVQYSRIRTHTFTGNITMTITDTTSGFLRLGLRDVRYNNGRQLGPTLQWNLHLFCGRA